MARIDLSVIAKFETNGLILPICVIVGDEKFNISNVKVDEPREHCPWGRQPIKYNCVIRQRAKVIYYDPNFNQWYSIVI